MQTKERSIRSGSAIPPEGPPLVAKPVQPTVVFAVIGAAFSALTLYVLVKWLTGPNFAPVPVGTDEPPEWMKNVLMGSQVLFAGLLPFNLYWFLVRPWRRSRRVPFDGVVCVALLISSIWDPASAYVQTWFGYNSYLWNWGSPIVELPGVLTPHAPGMAPAWPVGMMPGFYSCLPWLMILGCAVMRSAKRRWPHLGAAGLLAVAWAFALLVDFVGEGLIILPLGFWSWPGGWWPIINGGTYYQLPLNDLLHTATLFAGLCAMRYFTNDRGETIAERGLSSLSQNSFKRPLVRALAIIGLTNALFFGTWHIPNAFWGGANSRRFPEKITSGRSYFLNSCGPRVDRACPGPDVPISRSGSGYLDWRGRFVDPGSP